MIAAVDGCKGGWIVAKAQQWPPLMIPAFSVCSTFANVLNTTTDCLVVVVDMPIGLPLNGTRTCDVEARKILGGSGTSSVFNTPPRSALAAKDGSEFQELVRNINGVGAGLPVWGIVPKLREVDAQMTQNIQSRVKEYHPELAWKHYAKQMILSKHSAAGLLQRLQLIQRIFLTLQV